MSDIISGSIRQVLVVVCMNNDKGHMVNYCTKR